MLNKTQKNTTLAMLKLNETFKIQVDTQEEKDDLVKYYRDNGLENAEQRVFIKDN